MAQNITLLGASYSNVPAVELPKTGGGTAKFYDDTGSETVTENGTFDVTGLAELVVNVAGGGGASNYVTGTFTTSSTTGNSYAITIPYTGSGYPIAAMVFVTGGAYNTTSGGNTDWYNLTQRYAVGEWTMHKAEQNTTPTYATSGSNNYGVVTAIYKNSTSSATNYSRNSAMTTNAFTTSNATASATQCVRFISNVRLSYYVASTSYGLLANTEYTYHIIYSS